MVDSKLQSDESISFYGRRTFLLKYSAYTQPDYEYSFRMNTYSQIHTRRQTSDFPDSYYYEL